MGLHGMMYDFKPSHSMSLRGSAHNDRGLTLQKTLTRLELSTPTAWPSLYDYLSLCVELDPVSALGM